MSALQASISKPANFLKFENSKTKYFLNEEYLAEYSLDRKMVGCGLDLHAVAARETPGSSCLTAVPELKPKASVHRNFHPGNIYPLGSSASLTAMGQLHSRRSTLRDACSQCRCMADPTQASQALVSRLHAAQQHTQHLEHELELMLVANKKLKLSAQHARRERQAYQKFVNEMLEALSVRGAVRVIDGQGTEMMVRRVANGRVETEEKVPIAARTSQRERLLKAVIGSQEQTIRDLLRRMASTKGWQGSENGADDGDSYPDKNLKPTLAAAEQSASAQMPEAGGDSVAVKPEELLDEIPLSASTPLKNGDTVDGALKKQMLDELVEVVNRKQDGNLLSKTADVPTVVGGGPASTPPSSGDAGTQNAQEKPLALVVQGENMKYAVIQC